MPDGRNKRQTTRLRNIYYRGRNGEGTLLADWMGRGMPLTDQIPSRDSRGRSRGTTQPTPHLSTTTFRLVFFFFLFSSLFLFPLFFSAVKYRKVHRQPGQVNAR